MPWFSYFYLSLIICLIILYNPVIIPNSKNIIKNIGCVEKILSIPKPIKIETTIVDTKSILILIPTLRFSDELFFLTFLFFSSKILIFSLSFVSLFASK